MSFAYYYHSINVLSLSRSQSDNVNQGLLKILFKLSLLLSKLCFSRIKHPKLKFELHTRVIPLLLKWNST